MSRAAPTLPLIAMLSCFSEDDSSAEAGASSVHTGASTSLSTSATTGTTGDSTAGTVSASMTGTTSTTAGDESTTAAASTDDTGIAESSTTTTSGESSSSESETLGDGIDEPYALCDSNCDPSYHLESIGSPGCVCAPPCASDDECPDPGACIDTNGFGDLRCILVCDETFGDCPLEGEGPTVCYAFLSNSPNYACMWI